VECRPIYVSVYCSLAFEGASLGASVYASAMAVKLEGFVTGGVDHLGGFYVANMLDAKMSSAQKNNKPLYALGEYRDFATDQPMRDLLDRQSVGILVERDQLNHLIMVTSSQVLIMLSTMRLPKTTLPTPIELSTRIITVKETVGHENGLPVQEDVQRKQFVLTRGAPVQAPKAVKAKPRAAKEALHEKYDGETGAEIVSYLREFLKTNAEVGQRFPDQWKILNMSMNKLREGMKEDNYDMVKSELGKVDSKITSWKAFIDRKNVGQNQPKRKKKVNVVYEDIELPPVGVRPQFVEPDIQEQPALNMADLMAQFGEDVNGVELPAEVG
jgi:hypothetical protein